MAEHQPAKVTNVPAPRLSRRSKIQQQIPKYTRSDSTICPSYTHLTLPYRVVCRQRYEGCVREQQKQLIQEIQLHETLQPQALNGVRLHREFCNPIIKKVSNKDRITLTLLEERRVEYILKTPTSDYV